MLRSTIHLPPIEEGEFLSYFVKKKTLVRVLGLYYNNKKRTYCSKNDD